MPRPTDERPGRALPGLLARTTGPDDTRALGAALAGALRPGDVLLLTGDLGAGKTVLAQGIAAGLGVREPVTSPTFTLVRPLPCVGAVAGDAGAVRTMLHADLYRLERRREVVDLALGELVEDGAVAVVEWGEAAEAVLGADALTVQLEPPAEATRAEAESPGASLRVLSFVPAGTWVERMDGLARALAPWAVEAS